MRRHDLPPGQDGWQVHTYILALETACCAFIIVYIEHVCKWCAKGITQEVVRAIVCIIISSVCANNCIDFQCLCIQNDI